MLEKALARVDFDKARDRLFCVGDLVDRGAHSFDCLSLPFEPRFFGVRGNHEMLALDALQEGGGQAWDLWQMNGGSWVFLQGVYGVRSILQEAVEHLPYAREVEVAGKRIGMVHAEPPASWDDIEEASKQQLVWGRTRINKGDTTTVEGIDAVIAGHTIVEEPTWLGNVMYIDTGAFCNRQADPD